MQSGSIDALVIFLETAEDRIDVGFIQSLAFLYGHFFAELFGISGGKSGHRCAIDRSEFATRIVVIEYVIGRMFFVVSLAAAATNDVDAISVSIKECVNIADNNLRLWPVALVHAGYASDSKLFMV